MNKHPVRNLLLILGGVVIAAILITLIKSGSADPVFRGFMNSFKSQPQQR